MRENRENTHSVERARGRERERERGREMVWRGRVHGTLQPCGLGAFPRLPPASISNLSPPPFLFCPPSTAHHPLLTETLITSSIPITSVPILITSHPYFDHITSPILISSRPILITSPLQGAYRYLLSRPLISPLAAGRRAGHGQGGRRDPLGRRRQPAPGEGHLRLPAGARSESRSESNHAMARRDEAA